MIYQKVNYVLERLYFRKNIQSLRINVQIMLKADNYNKYDYDQVWGEK